MARSSLLGGETPALLTLNALRTRGPQRAEPAGPACWLSGPGRYPLGVVSAQLRARILVLGTSQATAAEQRPAEGLQALGGQPGASWGSALGSHVLLLQNQLLSAFFIWFLHYLVVCGPTGSPR